MSTLDGDPSVVTLLVVSVYMNSLSEMSGVICRSLAEESNQLQVSLMGLEMRLCYGLEGGRTRECKKVDR